MLVWQYAKDSATFDELFAIYDKDGSGALDFEEVDETEGAGGEASEASSDDINYEDYLKEHTPAILILQY